jgi:hypothetical protein
LCSSAFHPGRSRVDCIKTAVAQCDGLIAKAHQTNAAGTSLLPSLDREQITVAAFLNFFIAWETFLQNSIAHLMAGSPTIGGSFPTKYVAPGTYGEACAMIIGTMRYFYYASHENVGKSVRLYFEQGHPFEPHLGGIVSQLADLKIMRNASAHVSTTTQTAIEGLAIRVFGRPMPGITLYEMQTAVDPNSTTPETVFLSYKNKLIVTAELICK